VAVEGRQTLTSADPQAGADSWHAAAVDGALINISCPSTTLCVAGGQSGEVLVTTDPMGAAWSDVYYDRETIRSSPLHIETSILGVSCPAVSACIAIDGSGDIVRSTDPAGGGSAWMLTKVFPWPSTPPADLTSFDYLTCASATRCVGVFSREAGTHEEETYADVNYAPFGGGSWNLVGIASEAFPHTYPNPGVYPHPGTLSCPSVQLCVATDEAGQIIVGQAEVLTRAHLARLVRAAVKPPSVLSIRAILRHSSLSLPFTPPVEGALRMSLLAAPAPHQPHSHVQPVAIGLYTFHTLASEPIDLRLTSFGRRLLKHPHRERLTVQLTFKPAEAGAVTATEPLVLAG
jgi:hypothetical protein